MISFLSAALTSSIKYKAGGLIVQHRMSSFASPAADSLQICVQGGPPQGPTQPFLGPLYTIGSPSWPKQEALGISTGRGPQPLAFDVNALMAREAQAVVTRRAQHHLLSLTQALRDAPPPGFAQVHSGWLLTACLLHDVGLS